MQGIYKLKGILQHYNWGGVDFIPDLLGQRNIEKLPFAEYWIGAHSNHPANVYLQDHEMPLNRFIDENKDAVLGKQVLEFFDGLPFLFKVLDVRQMLSIQVHPSKNNAALGFARENEAGIALTASHRNYKDDNHKPEQMIALSDFWLLHGFKNEKVLVRTLDNIPEFHFLKTQFKGGGYQLLYQSIMQYHQKQVNKILQPLAERILPAYKSGQLTKDDENFWAARAIENFCGNGNFDRGIFSVYFFNLVHLKEGESIYQPPAMPHAYLEGQNIEVMANSDNVLRAGLTEKHIDIEEVLKLIEFKSTSPHILKPLKNGLYPSPAKEFEIHKYVSTEYPTTLKTETVEIFFIYKGNLELSEKDQPTKEFARGDAVLLTAGTSMNIYMQSESVFFRVHIPVQKLKSQYNHS